MYFIEVSFAHARTMVIPTDQSTCIGTCKTEARRG